MCFDLREKDIDDLGWSDRAHGWWHGSGVEGSPNLGLQWFQGEWWRLGTNDGSAGSEEEEGLKWNIWKYGVR